MIVFICPCDIVMMVMLHGRVSEQLYSCRMSVLTMMITTIDICLYVYLSSNECSYYDFNDNW